MVDLCDRLIFLCSTYFLMTDLYIRLKMVGRLFILCGDRLLNLCCGKFVDGNLGLCQPNLINIQFRTGLH